MMKAQQNVLVCQRALRGRDFYAVSIQRLRALFAQKKYQTGNELAQ
jgi:hypothetical protein